MQPDVLGVLINAGIGGILLVLFVRGYIAAKPAIDQLKRDVEAWRKLYESEKAAHDLTRKAHAEETRAELQAAAEGSRTAMALLEEIKQRQSEAQR